ncbi:MAG: TIGR04211 family SH3 domain-containing protein [Desulfurivibrio sp.]|nr:MAG: TIGR04211 family SH3 domain-containing protein [Desulfurivibrio sp.]
MMKNVHPWRGLLFFLLFFAFSVTCAQGEVVYVTDRLVVLLRSEPESGEKIAKLLSDTPLQVLEKKERFVKVRTEGGQEGWVEERYTTTDPPKQLFIESLEAEIKRLEANLTQLAREKAAQAAQFDKTKPEQVKALEESLARMQAEKEQLALRLQEAENATRDIREKSGHALETAEQLKRLQGQYSQLEVQNKLFREENEALRKKTYIYWFGAGAGVLFLGWLIGRIPRRRGSGKLTM